MIKVTEQQLVYEAVCFILQTKQLTKITPFKNGCFAVGYQNRGRIVSGRKVREILEKNHEYLYQKAVVRKLVQNSYGVEWVKHYSQSSYTTKGYRVTLNSCSCPFTKESSICKHMIAYARLTGIMSLNQYLKTLESKVA